MIDRTLERKQSTRGFHCIRVPLLPRRRHFQSKEVAAILNSAVLSVVSHRTSGFRVSSRNRAVPLACRPRSHRADCVAATQLDPERANSIIPDCRTNSDSAGQVSVESSAPGTPAEGLLRTDAAMLEFPALVRVASVSYVRNSEVTFASRLHCRSRWAGRSATVSEKRDWFRGSDLLSIISSR